MRLNPAADLSPAPVFQCLFLRAQHMMKLKAEASLKQVFSAKLNNLVFLDWVQLFVVVNILTALLRISAGKLCIAT